MKFLIDRSDLVISSKLFSHISIEQKLLHGINEEIDDKEIRKNVASDGENSFEKKAEIIVSDKKGFWAESCKENFIQRRGKF